MAGGAAGGEGSEIVHASCVTVEGRALLIRGRSGSGKSTLALQLMAFGAELVADDRVRLISCPEGVTAHPAPNLGGLIEARGVGILRAAPVAGVGVTCVVDLDQVEPDRLPHGRRTRLLGQSVTLLYRVDAPHFAPALIQYLKAGRQDPS
ncbi:MAG: serine kinase [Rhodobacteraceae bacterium]|nr:serine kinase [Paracoccaceae bacterium]